MPGEPGTISDRRVRLQRLNQVARFAFPQRHAIAIILGFTLAVAAISAVEPLILKALFDELAGARSHQTLIISVATLLGLAIARELLDGAGTSRRAGSSAARASG